MTFLLTKVLFLIEYADRRRELCLIRRSINTLIQWTLMLCRRRLFSSKYIFLKAQSICCCKILACEQSLFMGKGWKKSRGEGGKGWETEDKLLAIFSPFFSQTESLFTGQWNTDLFVSLRAKLNASLFRDNLVTNFSLQLFITMLLWT